MRILRPTGTFFICILWFGIEVFAPPGRGRLRTGLRFIISFACCRLCHTLSFFFEAGFLATMILRDLLQEVSQGWINLVRQNGSF
jgi:hypothetical protein